MLQWNGGRSSHEVHLGRISDSPGLWISHWAGKIPILRGKGKDTFLQKIWGLESKEFLEPLKSIGKVLEVAGEMCFIASGYYLKLSTTEPPWQPHSMNIIAEETRSHSPSLAWFIKPAKIMRHVVNGWAGRYPPSMLPRCTQCAYAQGSHLHESSLSSTSVFMPRGSLRYEPVRS